MEAEIRGSVTDDLDALYEVCLRTGDGGEDATAIYRDTRLLGEIYVGPYLMMRSGRGFTALWEGVPSGYVLAAADTGIFHRECEQRWWPPLRERYPEPVRGGDAPPTPDEILITEIHHPPRPPAEVVEGHPSHLHIDLLPVLQGQGVGTRMMTTMLDLLTAESSRGVHLAVDDRNHRAMGFYRHLGFVELTSVPGAVYMGLRLG